VPNWLTWVVAALLVWAVLSAVIGLFVARFFRLSAASLAAADDEAAEAASAASRATLIEAPFPRLLCSRASGSRTLGG
jgi:L-cystine uptake protein TcyP (sodium:dicarboxylate symporter family)